MIETIEVKRSCHFRNLTNLVVGKLSVLYEATPYISPKNQKITRWFCQCECRNTESIATNLIHKYKMCRQCRKLQRGPRYKDITNKIFDRLTAIRRVNQNQNYRWLWLCRCQCGTECVVPITSFIEGRTKSCGCLRNKLRQQLRWKGVGNLSLSYFNQIKAGAKKRGLNFNISIEYAWELYETQNGLCVLTGREIFLSKSCGNKKYSSYKENVASLDRIDSTKGYIKGNVQWVHKDVNKMKQDFSEESFQELCLIIVKHRLGLYAEKN